MEQSMINSPKISDDKNQLEIKMRLREFIVPPINDILVIGKNAPIGSEAWRRALLLLHVAPFECLKVDDDIIDEIFVQVRILKKISNDKLINLILKKVKPFMTIEEVIHIDIRIERSLEEII